MDALKVEGQQNFGNIPISYFKPFLIMAFIQLLERKRGCLMFSLDQFLYFLFAEWIISNLKDTLICENFDLSILIGIENSTTKISVLYFSNSHTKNKRNRIRIKIKLAKSQEHGAQIQMMKESEYLIKLVIIIYYFQL